MVFCDKISLMCSFNVVNIVLDDIVVRHFTFKCLRRVRCVTKKKTVSSLNVSSHRKGKTKLFLKKHTYVQTTTLFPYEKFLWNTRFSHHTQHKHPRSSPTNPLIPPMYRADLIFVCSFYVSPRKTFFFSAIHPNLFLPRLCVYGNNNNNCCTR